MTTQNEIRHQELLQRMQELLRNFKNVLANRIWSIPNISEAEKELTFRKHLTDMADFEKEIMEYQEKTGSHLAIIEDENEILRSLMGVDENDLRMRVLTLGKDLSQAKKEILSLKEDADTSHEKREDSEKENEHYRKRLKEAEERIRRLQLGRVEERKGDIQYFAEKNQTLKEQLQNLTSRIKDLKELFTETNEKILIERQDEITQMQKKLFNEMEEALRKKQELVWAEETLFARGVANRVRNALVSAQGQLFLTLERLGLLDPDTKSESTLLSKLKMLTSGGGKELRKNFQNLQIQFQEVTQTLDDYLHLTGMREIKIDVVDMKELVEKELAEVFTMRRPTLSIEFLPEDPMPSVNGDEELLSFVVRALFRNALEALPNQSGKIMIVLQNRSDRGHVVLSIKDTGEGIPPYLVPKLFQPFMSTKPGRQGLNLARARRYIDLHGGELKLVSTGQEGTHFEVTIPIDYKPLPGMVENQTGPTTLGEGSK